VLQFDTAIMLHFHHSICNSVNALESAKINNVVSPVTQELFSILALGYGFLHDHIENKLVPYLR